MSEDTLVAELMERKAREMSQRFNEYLEFGTKRLLSMGATLDELEIVSETCSPPDSDGTVIHQRAYVRRRADIDAARAEGAAEERERLANLAEDEDAVGDQQFIVYQWEREPGELDRDALAAWLRAGGKEPANADG